VEFVHMGYETREQRHISEEDRRGFLKVLGLGSAVAVGSATLDDVTPAVSETTAEELAPIGQEIQADLSGNLDATLLANQQDKFVESAGVLGSTVYELSEEGPRDEFATIADAGQPIVDHLADVDFFETTTQQIPTLTPSYLETVAKTFVGSEVLTAPLDDIGLVDGEGVDLVATVIANAEDLSTYHWAATDEIPRQQVERGEFIPPMTRAASEGVLLWLADLDKHLWQKKPLVTDDLLAKATWHARSMAAGFQLMTEGARVVADGTGSVSDGELAALLTTGFAIQAISSALLPQDVYWITEDMRAPRESTMKIQNGL
jgi:hypothetical protein